MATSLAPSWFQGKLYPTGFASQNNGVTVMRVLLIAVAALLLSIPALAPAKACVPGAAQVSSTTLSADKAKPPKKKIAEKTAKKKQKVEYMRAAPMK
jgi:hypothetical protein